MQRLSGLDATFLALDAGNACGHGGGVAVLDPDGPRVTAAHLVALFAGRMPPVLRRRLATVPLGLDLPYWADTEPVLAEHVHEVAVGPGGIPAAVADLHARRLERVRPLWAAYLMHSPGGQAVYLKVHHALVDGVGGNALLAALFGTEQPAAGGAVGAHSTPELLARSVASMPGRLGRAIGTGARAARALPSVRQQVLRRAPASVLGGTLSPGRQLALVSLPLAQVRQVRTALGLSVNDVAVTLTAGAMRNWLGVADELPPESLVAAVPMSLRVPGAGEGNQFVLMSTELATSVADPVERARATAGALDAAKRAYAALPPTVMADLTAVAAPALAGAAVALAGRVGAARSPATVQRHDLDRPGSGRRAGGRGNAGPGLSPHLAGRGRTTAQRHDAQLRGRPARRAARRCCAAARREPAGRPARRRVGEVGLGGNLERLCDLSIDCSRVLRMSARTWIAQVVQVERSSPSLMRVELGGDGLASFASLGVPDEACVFDFPVAEAARGLTPNPGRWYSLHQVGPATMTIGVVLHPGGLGSAWAERATVGETLTITGHNSWFRRPEGAQWQILLGDITALPAIDRILTESAAQLPTQAILEIPDPADEQAWEHPAQVRWVHNPDLALGSRLDELVRQLALPAGPGYVYVAGEAAATRAARKLLRSQFQLPVTGFGVVGYWRKGRPT